MKKKYYKVNGVLHKVDGPAIVLEDGSECWYFNGLKHRMDGPAVIMANGSKYWYLNNLLHRADGPAMDLPDGTNYWYLNGLKHRVGGPAVEKSSGKKQYWIFGVRLSKEEYEKIILSFENFNFQNPTLEKEKNDTIVHDEEVKHVKNETSHEDDPFEQKLDEDFDFFFNPKKETQEQKSVDKKIEYNQGTDFSDISEAQSFFTPEVKTFFGKQIEDNEDNK